MKLFTILSALILFNSVYCQQSADTSFQLELTKKIDSAYPKHINLKWYLERGKVVCGSFERQDTFFYVTNFSHPGNISYWVNPVYVPKLFLDRFDSVFPKATDLEWYNMDSLKEVSFFDDKHFQDIQYGTKGNILSHNRMILFSEAPKEIPKYIDEHYPKYYMYFVLNETENVNGAITYSVRLDRNSSDYGCSDCEYYLIKFNSKGEFTSEELVSSHKNSRK